MNLQTVNKKNVMKRHLDILLLILLEIQMCYQYIGQKAHESFGAAMIIAVIAHNFLSRKWYGSLENGKYTTARIVQTVINIALLLDAVVMLISGYVFVWLPINSGAYEARLFHLAGAHWGYLLMSVHMGMHFGMFNKFGVKLSRKKYGTVIKRILQVLGIVVGIYGLYALVSQNIIGYLFLTSQFYTWGTASNMFGFVLQNISMLYLFAKVTGLLMTYLLDRKNDKQH